MKISVKMNGARKLERTLRKMSRDVDKEVQRVLRSQARLLAREYGAFTAPPDLGGSVAVDGFKERIKTENARVFATRENPSAVFSLIKQIDPAKAKAYFHAVKSQKPRAAAEILRKAGVAQGAPDYGMVRPLRTGRRGRIVTGGKALLLTRSSEFRRYLRERQGTIGAAKAAWLQAAQAIGGRVRRGNREAFPAYVRKVSRKFSGIGGAWIGKGRVVIWSNLDYADEALEARMKAEAEDRAGKALDKSLTEAIAVLAAKATKAA